MPDLELGADRPKLRHLNHLFANAFLRPSAPHARFEEKDSSFQTAALSSRLAKQSALWNNPAPN